MASRAQNRAEEKKKGGKKEEGERRISSPSLPALTFFFCSLFFASSPLAERLEQASLALADSAVAGKNV